MSSPGAPCGFAATFFYEVVSYFGGLLGVGVYLDEPRHFVDERGRHSSRL